MITFHPSITMVEARRMADALDCYLLALPNGNVQITPKQQRNPAHTNGNVIKMPRRKLQYIGAIPE